MRPRRIPAPAGPRLRRWPPAARATAAPALPATAGREATAALPVARGRGRGLALALLLAPAVAAAQAVPQPGWLPRPVAELQALDKVSARVSVFPAPVGQTVRFGTLAITVRACHARPRDEVPDAAAWIEVRDERAGPDAPPAFRGWMFASAPAVNMLEHAVYDLRVLTCR